MLSRSKIKAHIYWNFNTALRQLMSLKRGYQVFHMEYILESKTKAQIMEFYLTDFALRGKGYGNCVHE